MYTQEELSNYTLNEIKGFSYPRLYIGKDWYIGFQAFDPITGKMRRKRIKINHIQKITDRRKFADGLMKRLTTKLEKGWNPWIESEDSKAYHTFDDVCDQYKKYITKMFIDRVYREDTYTSYLSYLRNVEAWNRKKSPAITYIYQFDKYFITDFLEHIYIDKNNSAQTRDNYLCWLRTFSTFLVQKLFLKTKPTEGITTLGRRLKKKQRTLIQDLDMIRLNKYLLEKNKHYLLACYILHYCFIRPKEMSLIKIEHISIKRQTIFIPEDVSKNRKSGTVTLPQKVLMLMLDLDIFKNPSHYFLFSDRFSPGEKNKSEKQFRDFWDHYVRKDLLFPTTYKFYSLKDTGITSMLRKYDTITVRDQARHSDILMTDMYTPHDIQEANNLIVNHDGIF